MGNMVNQSIGLDDKYSRDSGQVLISGVQAIVRLMLMQRRLDNKNGINTAGFISGYRGSPLGALDQTLWKLRPQMEQHQIHHRPAVNEELAAAAILGSQQTDLFPGANYDGVYSLWYGKGPGVDRAGDALKHGNALGTHPNGGVLVLAGDDHGGISSSYPHQSDQAFVSFLMPILNPATVEDMLSFGLYGFALSRFSGCWIGFKGTTEVVESTATIDLNSIPDNFVIPSRTETESENLHIRTQDFGAPIERRLLRHKLAAVLEFARANPINVETVSSPSAEVGLMATGKAYQDLVQALLLLGLDETSMARQGVRLYKVGMPWPLEPEGIKKFAKGLKQIIVVEEKRALIEPQLKDLFYHTAASERPAVIGKCDEKGNELLPEDGELSPEMIAEMLADRLGLRANQTNKVDLASIRVTSGTGDNMVPARTPYFCPGCPHSSSTRLPAGSHAFAGVGCHFLASRMDRNTIGVTAMGTEGCNWVGLAPFSSKQHIFQNMGEGTYFHSGTLAIRQAVAADVNITFKILFNDAVAMTGGQPVDGELTPAQVTHQVYHEGVQRIALVSDEPRTFKRRSTLAPGVSVHHRRNLETVQKELREISGVSVLLYVQTCAAEKRRRRKRGSLIDPEKRVFINSLLCDDCADCARQSNCLAVLPIRENGQRHRMIDQSACNKDFTCLDGFCPSMVTVEGARLRPPLANRLPMPISELNRLTGPKSRPLKQPHRILITGVGGTGVVTIGAIVAMAAHLEGKQSRVLDFTGMAQKGGSVLSHITIAPADQSIPVSRIGNGQTDVLIGCDLVVALSPEALATTKKGLTRAIVNRHYTPAGLANFETHAVDQGNRLAMSLQEHLGDAAVTSLNATKLATKLEGDTIAANLFLLGMAFQQGLIPLSLAALERAIELNGVAVEKSKRTLGWGRLAVQDPVGLKRLVASGEKSISRPPETLDEKIQRLASDLSHYQDNSYADRFRKLVKEVQAMEQKQGTARMKLTEAVTENLYRLMAIKDPYEVARLYTDGRFENLLKEQFEGRVRLRFHFGLNPLSHRDAGDRSGRKYSMGPWFFHVLKIAAYWRRWRGTRMDPFGRNQDYRNAIADLSQYEADIGILLASLNSHNLESAIELARAPELVRGFGRVRMAARTEAEQKREQLLNRFLSAGDSRVAA